MKLIRFLFDWLGWERLSETRARHEQLIQLIHTNHRTIMATLTERFAFIETALDEAGNEINAELAKLREQIATGVITPEALETIGRIEAKAAALASIIPNTPPAEPAS